MNQKWLVLLLALLLCGCQNQQTPLEVQGVSGPAIAVTEPTDSVGFYAPNSLVEQATNGAVKAFPLSMDDVLGIRFLGDDILLFTGQDATRLTLLSGDNRCMKAEVQLSCSVLPDDPAVLVNQQGIVFVNHSSQELVFLDDLLQEVHRIGLPADCNSPALTANHKLLYYGTAEGIRVLELETGLDRLLREMSYTVLELIALHCDDTLLQCRVTYDDGTDHMLFFAADTGILLQEGKEDLQLWTDGGFYVATCMDGTYQEWLTGMGKHGPYVLALDAESAATLPLPEFHGLITYRLEDGYSLLECYQLESGQKIARVTLPGIFDPSCVKWEAKSNTLWFLAADPAAGQTVLYAWSLGASATESDVSYLHPRWSQGNPDLEGLAQCSLLAQRLSVKYGVNILLWSDATACEPWDYSLIAEYQVPLLRRRLEELDHILSCFPEGFLEKAASRTGSGRLSICLVRSIQGKIGTGALDSAMGLQFWDKDARAYLAITTSADMAQHLYHELFHIIDTYILTSCKAFDDWSKLNPMSFSYDIQYSSTRSDEGRSFLTEENRYFVDLYSMSSPKEDRARIMEYAMLDGYAALFQSAPMQAKLCTLCKGIRDAFGLKSEPVIFRWEQYLDAPLTP